MAYADGDESGTDSRMHSDVAEPSAIPTRQHRRRLARRRRALRLPIVGSTAIRTLPVASDAFDRVRAPDSTKTAEGTR
jgi:hypothetical protein